MKRLSILVLLCTMWFTASGTSAETTCEMTPLALPLFGGTPIAAMASPAATPTGELLTEPEAEEVLQQYVACTNTGDPTLVWAMFTPRWFSAEFANSEEHYLPAFEYDLAQGEQPVVDPLVLASIDEISLTPDGRTAVTATFSSGDMIWTDTLILVKINGTWMIDEVVLVTPPA